MEWPKDIEPTDTVRTREAAVEFLSKTCTVPPDFNIDEASIHRLDNRWVIEWVGKSGHTLEGAVDKTDGKMHGCYSVY